MALAKRLSFTHDQVFPFGAFLVSEVTQIFDYDRSTKDNKVQATDPESGLLMWSVDVVDADPEARRANRTVSIKFAAKVQPVPPANDGSSPFTPVVFEGLTALPYVEKVGEDFSRIAWSLRADAMTSPKQAAKTTAASSGSSSSSSSSTAA